MDRDFLRELAVTRIEETEVLLRNEKWSGAYYLSGYCIECALKACIAKQTERYDFPDKKEVLDSYTHDLNKLLKTSRLRDELKKARVQNAKLDVNWKLVRSWSEESRYNTFTKEEAKALYNAISDKNNGVLRWISRYW